MSAHSETRTPRNEQETTINEKCRFDDAARARFKAAPTTQSFPRIYLVQLLALKLRQMDFCLIDAFKLLKRDEHEDSHLLGQQPVAAQ